MVDEKDPFPNKEYKGCEFKRADMTQTHFNAVNLSHARFWAVLECASFQDTNLRLAKFDDVNLAESTYENVNLSGAKYNNVNLAGASFSNLNLSNVEIKDANLEGMTIDGVLVSDMFEAWQKRT